jgi:hypothetical protein
MLISLYIITITFEGIDLSVGAFCVLGREIRMPGRSPLRSLSSGFRAAVSHFGMGRHILYSDDLVLSLSPYSR